MNVTLKNPWESNDLNVEIPRLAKSLLVSNGDLIAKSL